MREYVPKFPLNPITPQFSDKNRDLFLDKEGNLISNNITHFTLKTNNRDAIFKAIEYIEDIVKFDLGNHVGVCYHYLSGNFWVRLMNKRCKNLEVQKEYEKLNGLGYEYWNGKLEEFDNNIRVLRNLFLKE